MEDNVVIRDLSKHFRRRDGQAVHAIDHASLEIGAGEFVVLLGPSGCGKTTLLRSVAGLETPNEGSIAVGGRTLFSAHDGVCLAPERRQLSMMFQSYALWPHMTAAENVRYPLENRRQRMPRREMDAKVQTALDLVGIGALGAQYASQLSGGQQQRVALARALVNDSSLVLFDEPLSNVDAKVREQLRIEILATQRRLGFTALFVTHDQAEAMELATRIAVLDKGKVQQIGTPAEVYRNPATEYVARFIGNTNDLSGHLTARAAGTASYETEVGALQAHTTSTPPEHAALLWRPEAGHLSADRPLGMNAFPGRVVTSLFLGTHTEFLVRSGETLSRIWTTGRTDFAADEDVWVGVRPDDLMVFDGAASVTTDLPLGAALTGSRA
ncbi:ABC transporter ATP-binding protein [Sinomonas flava]|uniref:ABC transporter ATP-binding protein n=1 Tax=Sinomonas flava TaxID=496857 RepID=UPI0039A57C51